MARERRPRDPGDLVLASLVAGGTTSVASIAPSIIQASGAGSFEAQLTSALMVVFGAGVFVVAALVALLVYGLGLPWVPHVALAGITSCAMGAAILVTGRSSPDLTAGGMVVLPAVFLILWSTIAVRHRARRVSIGNTVPRSPLALTAVLAGLVGGAAIVVQSVVANFRVLTDPSPGDHPEVIAPWILVGAIPGVLAIAWLVVIVLLVDQRQAPRVVPAIVVGLLTPVLVPYPLFVISGIPDVAETLTWGAASGVAAGVVVFFSQRPVAAKPTDGPDQLRAAEVGEPA